MWEVERRAITNGDLLNGPKLVCGSSMIFFLINPPVLREKEP
jgi:hypothetical protein